MHTPPHPLLMHAAGAAQLEGEHVYMHIPEVEEPAGDVKPSAHAVHCVAATETA